ncbi:MAG TPA: hypothetical protein VES20_22435 [Bryobacteraceae bacterium]|nr:hypothetical protein [Bryobacteraceae bacterium]
MTGWTTSANFPTTSGVLYPAGTAGAPGFVTKLNPEGTALIYSTKLKGITPTAAAV